MSVRTVIFKLMLLCLRQSLGCGGYYIFTVMMACHPMPTSDFFTLHNTERILMKFGEGNHYHQTDELIAFWAKFTRDKGARYDRKFESTSNQCCHVANDFTYFTLHRPHTACCVYRAGEFITHMQWWRHLIMACGL